jgi:uncharacterized protein (TIGR02118 family)
MEDEDMVTLSIAYPYAADARFDADYFTGTHIPLCRDVWGDAVTGVTVHLAVAGLTGDPAFAAIAQVEFASMEAFQQAIGLPRNAEVQDDVPNYSSVAPLVQLSRKAIG